MANRTLVSIAIRASEKNLASSGFAPPDQAENSSINRRVDGVDSVTSERYTFVAEPQAKLSQPYSLRTRTAARPEAAEKHRSLRGQRRPEGQADGSGRLVCRDFVSFAR